MSIISVTRTIPAPVDEVWRALADFGGIHRFSAAVESSPINEGTPETGLGAERLCTLYDGNHLEERVTGWVEGKQLDIEVIGTSMPLKRASGRFELVSAAGGGTQITMTFDFTVKYGPVGWLMDQVMMKRMMRGSLGNLLAALEHHVTTGEDIGRDWKAAA